jgi:starch phosphorylase
MIPLETPQFIETVDVITRKIKHCLITSFGKTLETCSNTEFYRAFCMAFREEIMINWVAISQMYQKKHPRVLYYLCMEYMPGRFLTNNLLNLHAQELIKEVLRRLNKNFADVLSLETDPGLGNGGLGRLAACILDSMATQNYPVIGYGLRYQYGIFDQEIWNGKQIERPEIWLLNENPWEFRRDNHAVNVPFCGRIIQSKNRVGEEVYDLVDYDEVRAVSYDYPIIGYKESKNYNISTLRLWTTKESPRNFQLQRFNAGQLDQAAENTLLTDVLYPNDNNEVGKRIRLKQEFLLSSASVQDVLHHFDETYDDINLLTDKVRFHVNDTHPVLAIAELMHNLMYRYQKTFHESLEMTQSIFNYTNHTVLKESLEEWNQHRMNYLLPRQYKIIERINQELCDKVRKAYPNDEAKVQRMSIIEKGQVKMADLAIFGSNHINGVAKLHSELLKTKLFPDFYQMYPKKFENVTNGVTQRRWIMLANPELSALITEKIGPEWKINFRKIKDFQAFAEDEAVQKRILEIKKSNKQKLNIYLRDHCPLRNDQGLPIACQTLLFEEALYDLHIKRIHEYKRQLMSALHTLMIYQELKKDPNSKRIKRQVIFAGKAAPGYTLAKNIIQFISILARTINQDIETSSKLRLVFIENYNISLAEKLIPAADLSEQISTAGMEASGTGNMKLAMNGALTIGTEDGANIEMHEACGNEGWPFAFGSSALENEAVWRNQGYSSFEVYINHPQIRDALDVLKEGKFCENDEERAVFSSLFKELIEKTDHSMADRYFVLKDMPSYIDAQKKVESYYQNPKLWAKTCIINIASMGDFSCDETVHNYAKKIWHLEPLEVDQHLLDEVKRNYSEYDKCRIF